MRGFTLSSGIGKIPNIERFLGVERLSRNPLVLTGKSCKAVYSWGHKPYSKTAAQIAKHIGVEHIRLEDGFVCSYGRGLRKTKYSIVSDSVGIYYDATAPSRLENILNNVDEDSVHLTDSSVVADAKKAMQTLLDENISKYNITADSVFSSTDDKPYVLVVDQTHGDQSVHYGGMQQLDFDSMLEQAISDYSADQVLVKVHPDVLSGRKNGYLAELAKKHGVKLVSGDISAPHLARCKAAYVGTSLYGFELLMRNVPVVCFGQPFYSSWGLTEDKKPVARRQQKRSLLEVFIAAYLFYPKYIDPVTGLDCSLLEIIAHISEQQRQLERVKGSYNLVGITPWKRGYVNRYVMGSIYKHCHVGLNDLERMPASAANDEPTVLVWGKKAADSDAEKILERHRVARMEDGFVRSVGLGSNYTAPRSLVVDDLGIYFDATQPSRLEYLLEHRDCSDAEVERAESLIRLLLENSISKYTSSGSNAGDQSFYSDKSVLLVVGQVQGDASLRYGTLEIDSNYKLLQKVRENNPTAVIVYKPHPDVVSGNRSDGIDNYCHISEFCNRIETELSIDVTLKMCEEVHTLTSLAGFEALLYGKKVVTYGKPFYAGWGLTEDCCTFERRTRVRTLAELVFISYIEYPGYLDIESGEMTSVEKTIFALINERKKNGQSLTVNGLKKYVNIVRNIRKGLSYAA